MARQVKKGSARRGRASSGKYGGVRWEDFVHTAKQVITNRITELDGSQNILSKLLNGAPVRTSLRNRGALLGNWLLLHAVLAMDDQESYASVSDPARFTAMEELVILAYEYVARQVGSDTTPAAYPKLVEPTLDDLLDSLDETWTNVKGSPDVDSIMDDFEAQLDELVAIYDAYPLEVDGSFRHKGALLREGGVRIATALFGDYDSKDAVMFMITYGIWIQTVVLQPIDYQKFIA